jgi:hypothetical protein
MKRKAKWRFVIALLILSVGLGYSYLRLIHLPHWTSYQANVALDRTWEPQASRPSDMPNAVLLFRTGRNGVICHDAFPSEELHDRLLAKNGHAVTVEYEILPIHDKTRFYRVHSVDGMILAYSHDGRSANSAGNPNIVDSGKGDGIISTDESDCW